jgi:ABC-type Fe3+ transport system substrate-binding protein
MIFRNALASLALAAAVASAGWTQAHAAADAALVAAAKKEGQVVWYTTLILDTAVRPLMNAFQKKYPGITVSYSRADSAPTALKIINEAHAGKVQADVFDGTETSAPIIQAGLAGQYVPTESDKYPAEMKDPNGRWHAFMLYYLTPAINTELVKPQDAPKSLDDLLDPKWKGKIAWVMSSSTGGISFISGVLLSLGEEKGMDYLRKLARQKIINVDITARAMVDRVGAGDYPIALGIFNHHTVMNARKGAPVTWLKLEPIVAPLALMGITKDAPHPHAARLFYDYVVSTEGQKLLASRGFLPAMPSVPPLTPSLTPQVSGFKPIYLNQDTVIQHGAEWKRVMKDLFE